TRPGSLAAAGSASPTAPASTSTSTRNDKGFQIRRLELPSREDTGLEALRLAATGLCRPVRIFTSSLERRPDCGDGGAPDARAFPVGSYSSGGGSGGTTTNARAVAEFPATSAASHQ